MSNDDPFNEDIDSNRTIIRPTPGRRGGTPRQQPAGHQAKDSPPRPVTGQEQRVEGSGLNPLVNAATSLLALVGQLRGTPSHPDIMGLREQVMRGVKLFESEAREAGVAQETVFTARYILCALIDETVLSTPWGSDSLWSSESLLSSLHNETWGGEKFFAILERMLQEPASNLELLELIYICLALGFEGKYRVMDRGRLKLDEIQENLFRAIRMQRGDYEHELSPHWQGVQDRRNPIVRYVPLWVVAVTAGALLLVMYLTFRLLLNNVSDPVFRELGMIGRQAVVVSGVSAPAPEGEYEVQRLGLDILLQPDIDKGHILVEEEGGAALIRILDEGLFRSGSVIVSSDFKPLLERIAIAVNQVPGRVLIIGHTDNVPIRSLRFQSNWELSRARAASVADFLSQYADSPSRFVPEGRADTEPLVPNDTPQNRARNRRVEIAVL